MYSVGVVKCVGKKNIISIGLTVTWQKKKNKYDGYQCKSCMITFTVVGQVSPILKGRARLSVCSA